jgi:hypothetical protein
MRWTRHEGADELPARDESTSEIGPGWRAVIWIAFVLALGFACLQLLPARVLGLPVQVVGSNPPERGEIDAPPAIRAILRRSCFDCHSNETRWPFYTRIAPASWLMAYDIQNARRHLNLSEWDREDSAERKADKEDCWDQISSGRMPRWYYVYPFHVRARLSSSEKATLKAWLLGSQSSAGSTP